MGTTHFPIGKKNPTYWFLEVSKLLNDNNHRQGSIIPTFSNLTGSPTIDAYYDRKGAMCFYSVTIDGTSSTSSASIDNLPYKAIKDGMATVFNFTDNTLIGYGTITSGSLILNLPDWSVTTKKILITTNYIVRGF